MKEQENDAEKLTKIDLKTINEFFFKEKNDKIFMAKIISALITVLGIVMSISCALEHNYFLVFISIGYGLLMFISFVIIRKTKKITFFYIASLTLAFVLEICYLITGGQNGFGILWVTLVPLYTIYLLEYKGFTLVNSIVLLILILGFWTPLNQFCWDFGKSFRIRFPILYFMEAMFAIAIRNRITKNDKNRANLLKQLIDLQKNLQKQVEERTLKLRKEEAEKDKLLMEVTIALAATIDAKDKYTSGHSQRVAQYSRKIAEKLGKSEKEQNDIFLIALLHDIGKIGVPDEIINKTEKLTDEEFSIIKQHPEIGSDILQSIDAMEFIGYGARWHHERFDGKGYPDHLKAYAIPEISRIISVADSYDAMTSNRSYRNILSQDVVRSEIENGKGTQFDPIIADAMLELIDEDTYYSMHS